MTTAQGLFAGKYGWLKPGLIVGAVSPLAVLFLRGLRGTLEANPVAEILNQLGLLALIFLIASLACSPLKKTLGWTWPMRLRRTLGLLAFFYACLHVLTYLGPDRQWALGTIFEDVTQRPFIVVGFLAFVSLVPLALTSTNEAVKRMGFVRWQRLHRLAYVAGALASIHFIWRVKSDLRQPLIYAGVLAALLLVRVGYLLWKRTRPHVGARRL